MFISCGILFNHESPRRGRTFVTQKIACAAARVACGLPADLRLGNIYARRDWGYAPDYVKAMWLMLQAESADDFVIATGQSRSVEDVLRAAFPAPGPDWRTHTFFDSKYRRPTETHEQRGNASKAYRVLGWQPTMPFKDIIQEMIDAECRILRGETTK